MNWTSQQVMSQTPLCWCCCDVEIDSFMSQLYRNCGTEMALFLHHISNLIWEISLPWWWIDNKTCCFEKCLINELSQTAHRTQTKHIQSEKPLSCFRLVVSYRDDTLFTPIEVSNGSCCVQYVKYMKYIYNIIIWVGFWISSLYAHAYCNSLLNTI